LASLVRASVTLMRDLLICGSIAGVTALICRAELVESICFQNRTLQLVLSIMLWIIYSLAQGSTAVGVWLVGYECCCGRFSKSSAVNHVTGLILHSACLVPYQPRRAYREREKNRAYLSWTLSQDAFALLKVASWMATIRGTCGVVCMLAMLYKFSTIYGSLEILKWYGGPYLVFNCWLVVYLNLLENSPLSNAVEADRPNASEMNSETLEYFTFEWLSRNLNRVESSHNGRWSVVARWLGDHLHHHIPLLNLMEAVDFRIPHYHAREAAKAVKQLISRGRQLASQNKQLAATEGADIFKLVQ